MTIGKAATIFIGGALLAAGGCGMFLQFAGLGGGGGNHESVAWFGAAVFFVGVGAALVGFLVLVWKTLKAIFTKTP